MSAVSGPRSRVEESERIRALKVSSYDRVSSLLITLLIMVGMAFAILFAAWLSARLVFHPLPPKTRYVEEPYGRGDHAAGFARDAEAPGEEELPELQEPQLEATLEAVTDAVSSIAASLDVLDTADTLTSKGVPGQLGDSRPPGPLGDGGDIVPRYERWQVKFESSSVEAYAQQLDFFKIELGAVGGKPDIDYAFNLSKPKPDVRTGKGEQEKRLYMSWTTGALKRYDRLLLTRAGIETQGRLTLQFFPPEVENSLAELEMANANNRDPREFLKTIFGVQSNGGQFTFHVIEQRFRPAPARR